MAEAIDVQFHRKGDPRLWPDLNGVDGAHGHIRRVGILEDGTTEGRPSVMVAARLDDGSWVFVETTAHLWLAVAAAIRGAHPGLDA